MSKIKVSTLTGPLLDYWVGRSDDDSKEYLLSEDGRECLVRTGAITAERYSPSTDWAQGGPLIERELDPLIPYEDEKSAEGIWMVGGVYKCQLKGMGFVGEGRTILEAAMRTFVGDKFGEEVDE